MIRAWQNKHGISDAAVNDLMMFFEFDAAASTAHSESAVQSLVRLDAQRNGVKLWRNNVGVLLDKSGRPIRYGLANDSKKLNTVLKSGDLIGWRSVTVTPQMTGTVIAQFVSRECKAGDWRPRTNDSHEAAQRQWAGLVNLSGGDAKIVNSEGSF